MSIFKRCVFHREAESLAIGTGLGHCDLFGQAICDGDIQFCENPGKLREELLEQKKAELRKDGEEEDQTAKQPHYKVLVVEDEEPLGKIVVAFLSRQGHAGLMAKNGVEGLNRIHENKFDAVVTDIVMPGMDGIALTKELLSLYPNLPIMIMTAYSKEHPAESAIRAGARDFIGKPFGYDEFILRFGKMMSDHEIFLQIEEKQKEMLFNLQRESSERINELQREIESLKGRLHAGPRGFETDEWL